MATFKMDDSTVVNTAKAKKSWDQDTFWNGNNNIGVATRSQWIDEKLYLSSKGRYYTVTSPRISGQTNSAEYLTDEEAAAWLIANGHETPDELQEAAKAVEE
jgi:hypothetical protein